MMKTLLLLTALWFACGPEHEATPVPDGGATDAGSSIVYPPPGWGAGHPEGPGL